MMVSSVDDKDDGGGPQLWWMMMVVDDGGSGQQKQWMALGVVDDDCVCTFCLDLDDTGFGGGRGEIIGGNQMCTMQNEK